jgi:outer membrane protein OmpA-like peptidoglycan-associated protein
MALRLLMVPLLLALAGTAAAQAVRQYRAAESVDPNEIAAILGQPKPIKMRSIRLLDGAAMVEPTAAQATAPAALSLPVQFDFDSAEILPAARPQLDALARGILLLPAQQPVLIQGHTDTRGSDQYNDQLSQRRAHAVKRYPMASHGIDGSRLRAVGLGEHQPLPGVDPDAAENRRVQFSGQ